MILNSSYFPGTEGKEQNTRVCVRVCVCVYVRVRGYRVCVSSVSQDCHCRVGVGTYVRVGVTG